MSNSRKNVSKYIDKMYLPKTQNAGASMSPVLLVLSVFTAFFIMALTAQPLIAGLMNKNTGGTSANAIGLFCSTTMGIGMDSRSGWANDGFGDYPLPNKSSRTWTMEEALGKGATLIQYHGEGEGTSWAKEKEEPTGSNYKNYAKQYKDKLDERRTASNCLGNGISTRISNLGFGIANLITGFAKFFSIQAFGTELVCSDPAKPTGSCLNLGKIIGGTGGENQGIIGALTSSIYLPLLVIAVAFTAGWVLYIGFVKRKIREALFGIIWLVASVVIGLSLLLNPSLLAKAPIAFSNAVSVCVIGAFNGENCMNGGNTGENLNYTSGSGTSKNVCKSSVSGANLSQRMMMTTNAISCSIWKAFVLEPLAQSTFGLTFDELDANTGVIKENIEEAGLKPEAFCVNLYSSKSYNSMKDNVLELKDGNKMCNVLAYQMYLQINAVSAGDSAAKPGDLPSNGSIDDRWYKVVAVAAAKDGTWSDWNNSGSNLAISFIAVLASALGSFIIIITAIFALVYYIGAVILMAFAPIFFLFAVHPGRGKKIFLGWLEKIVSSLLKYLMSAVFLVATLAIYGAVLSGMSSLGLTLLFVIIVTMALFMYRNELMGLLGRANMGGEQLSNAMSNSLSNMAKGVGGKSKNLAQYGSGLVAAGAAGGAGALIATGGLKNGPSIGERLKTGYAGAKQSAGMNVRRRGGLLGSTVAQYERSSTQNKQALRNKQAILQDDLIDAENDKKRELATQAAAEKNHSAEEQKHNLLAGELENNTERYNEFRQAEKESSEDMVTNSAIKTRQTIATIEKDPTLSPAEKEDKIAKVEANHKMVVDFANYQNLANTLHEAKMQLRIAEATGDTAAIEQYTGEIATLTPQKNELYNSIGANNVARLRNEYRNHLNEHLNDHDISSFGKEDFEKYQNLRIQAASADDKLAEAARELELADEDLKLSNAKFDKFKLRYDAYGEEIKSHKAGTIVKDSDLINLENNIDAQLKEKGISDKDIQIIQDRIDALREGTPVSEIEPTPFVMPIDGRFGNDNTNNLRDDDHNVSSANNGEYYVHSDDDVPLTEEEIVNLNKPSSKRQEEPLKPQNTNRLTGVKGTFPEEDQLADAEAAMVEEMNQNDSSSRISPLVTPKTNSDSRQASTTNPIQDRKTGVGGTFPEEDRLAEAEAEMVDELYHSSNTPKKPVNNPTNESKPTGTGIPTSPASPTSKPRKTGVRGTFPEEDRLAEAEAEMNEANANRIAMDSQRQKNEAEQRQARRQKEREDKNRRGTAEELGLSDNDAPLTEEEQARIGKDPLSDRRAAMQAREARKRLNGGNGIPRNINDNNNKGPNFPPRKQ